MKPRTFAILLGLVAAIAGVVLMVLPNKVTLEASNIFDSRLTEAVGVDCNSGFGDTLIVPLGAKQSDARIACDDAEGTRSTWSWVLIGAGLVLVAGGAVVGRKTVSAPVATSTS